MDGHNCVTRPLPAPVHLDTVAAVVWDRAADARSAFRGRLLFIEDYDINVGRHLVQGVDFWINDPRHEAGRRSC